jgi:hypothetical protein
MHYHHCFLKDLMMVFQYNRENETNTENEVVDVESRRGEA